MGKYIEKLAQPADGAASAGSGVTMAFLAENGF